MATELLIKDMVCNRCVTVLKADIAKRGLPVREVSLGKITLDAAADEHLLQQFQNLLLPLGFDLLIDKQTRTVNQVKEVIDSVLSSQAPDRAAKLKLSALLADKLNMSYSTLSEIFSRVEGVTVEQYVIQKRLEKVQELLLKTSSTLTEIAYITGFSSVHHLSGNFKDLTGLAPSQYREIKKHSQDFSAS